MDEEETEGEQEHDPERAARELRAEEQVVEWDRVALGGEEKSIHAESIQRAFCHKKDKKGIKGVCLSHNLRMEQQTESQTNFTKADLWQQRRVSITADEAVEYREYKRQRKRAEILGAIADSEGVLTNFEDVKRVRERAMRLRQAAVRMSTERLEQLGEIFIRSGVAVDCTVGGDGETIARVKAYEARRALRLKAKEITVMLSPYSVANCRYGAIRKELKKLRRATKKAVLKCRVDRVYGASVLSEVGRICAETGLQYFCVPYFEGCEKLKQDLKNGCLLQVSEVNTLTAFKKMRAAGVRRIVTSRAWEMYSEWMKEVEKIDFPELKTRAEVLRFGAELRGKGEKTMENSVLKEEKLPLLPLPKTAETKTTV